MTEYWIQEAIKRPGSLRAWMEKHRAEIRRTLGEDPFTSDGTIKASVLKKLKKRKDVLKKISGTQWRTVHKKIVLAETLRRLRR